MTDQVTPADRLRSELASAKHASNTARKINALRADEGLDPAFTDDDLRAFRRLVHETAAMCRAAGADIGDLVAGNVGEGDFPG